MKQPIIMYTGVWTMLISAVYFVIFLQFWPKAHPIMIILILFAGALTQRQLAAYYGYRQTKRIQALMESKPYYYMRVELEAICKQRTARSGSYTATSANGDTTVDIDLNHVDYYATAWEISVTTCDYLKVAFDGEHLFKYLITTYVLLPDTPVVDYRVTGFIKTADQTQEEGESLIAEDTKLEYMDEQVHAIIQKAFVQVGCIVANELH